MLLRSQSNTYSKTSPPFLKESEILTFLPEGRVFVLNKIHSTNQYVIDQIPNVKSGDAFVTEDQTQGRGRRGKIWVTSFGKNICLSMYWKLHRVPSTMVELSLMISMIVASILKNLGVSHIKIKWPNDLYIFGRKLAGILIEIITKTNSLIHVVIGIGINVSIYDNCVALKTKMSANWISLEDIGIILNRNVLIAILIDVLRKKLRAFEYYGFASFISYWNIFDCLYNKSVTLLINNHVRHGIALGINEYGALIVNQLGIMHYYSSDDISVCIS